MEDESDKGKPEVGKDEDPHIEDVRTKQYYIDIILNSCKDFVRRLNA